MSHASSQFLINTSWVNICFVKPYSRHFNIKHSTGYALIYTFLGGDFCIRCVENIRINQSLLQFS